MEVGGFKERETKWVHPNKESRGGRKRGGVRGWNGDEIHCTVCACARKACTLGGFVIIMAVLWLTRVHDEEQADEHNRVQLSPDFKTQRAQRKHWTVALFEAFCQTSTEHSEEGH